MVSYKSKERVIVLEDENEESYIQEERDFLCLNEYRGNSSKRVAENEQIQAEIREKKSQGGILDISSKRVAENVEIQTKNREKVGILNLSCKRVAENENVEKKAKAVILDLSLALPGASSSSSSLQQSLEPSNNNTRIGYFRNGSLSSCYSHPFSHNLSHSLALSSSKDSDQINLYSSLGGSSLALGCQLVNKERCDSNFDRISSLGSNSFFSFEFPARPTIDSHESGLANSRVSASKDGGSAFQLSGPERILIVEELPDEKLETTMEYLRGGDLKVVFERCPNVNCKRVLPVDDCKCKICSTKKGFCKVCMCQLCLKFDSYKNTCSWVGCDTCSHWCHAVCALPRNLIKSCSSIKGPSGTNEMQFHCLGCGHATEMFGFARDIYIHFAKSWSEETLMEELDNVQKIFHGSEDFKGKELHAITCGLFNKLEEKMISPSDACDFIFHFFKYTDGLSRLLSSTCPASMPLAAKSSFNIMSSSNGIKDMITVDHHQNDAKDPS